jgi:hypothetical protein
LFLGYTLVHHEEDKMSLPKATDDEMLAGLNRIGTTDQQVAFMARLLHTAYGKLAPEPWVQRWISAHATTLSRGYPVSFKEVADKADVEEKEAWDDWKRRAKASWRKPFKWGARQLNKLAYPRMPGR